MVAKKAMGVMRELDPINTITQMLGASTTLVGWLMHFMIGIIWGAAFALTSRFFAGPFWLRGADFSVIRQLIMMIVMMQMAGAGLFGSPGDSYGTLEGL